MAKKTIIDNSLVNSIRQRNAMYNQYVAPQIDYATYSNIMHNTPVDAAPDNYGVGEHLSSAYYTWQRNKQESIMTGEYGNYTRLDQDSQTLSNLLGYLNTDITKVGDLDNVSKESMDALNTVMNDGMNDSALNNRIKSYLQSNRYDLAISEINHQLDESADTIDPNTGAWKDDSTLAARKSAALFKADVARQELDKAEAKINPYFKLKDQTTELNFTDLDTYLYKLPGLLGSSAATIEADIATTAGSWATGAAIGSSIGGPVGAAVGAIGAGGVAIAGNLYSRNAESNMEVYTNYKQKVQKELQDKGIEKKILADARANMRELGMYTDEQINDDEFVYDQILTNRVKVNDNRLNKAKINNREGLKSVYLDNMALSASDVAQTMIEVMPFGFGKIARAMKLDKLTRPLGKFRNALSKRIDDVVAYGLDKADDLSTLTWRKAVKDLGGRMLVSGFMEGAEEGTQYIKGQNYINGNYDNDAGIIERWLDNTVDGARSIFAALTPWDPVYSTDKEFMDNFKGGMLLGGLMTGIYGGATSTINTANQMKVDRLISSLYAENMEAKDRVRKDTLYSSLAGSSRFDRVDQSFDNLKQLNIDGITEQDIEEERTRANQIRNIRNSSVTLSNAKKINIDPRTKEYDAYVALSKRYYDMYDDTFKLFDKTSKDVESLINSDEANRYANALSEELRSKGIETTPDEIKNIILNKATIDTYNQMYEQYDRDGSILQDIQDNMNYQSNSADLFTFKQIIDKNRKEIEKLQGPNKALTAILNNAGVTADRLQVPAIQEDLSKAIYKQIGAKIAFDRAAADNELFHSTKEKQIKAKINQYLDTEDRDNSYVADLDDLNDGNDIRRANEEGEIIGPPTIDSPVSPEPEPISSTPTSSPAPTSAAVAAEPEQQQQSNQINPTEETAVNPLTAPEGTIPEGRVNIVDETQPKTEVSAAAESDEVTQERNRVLELRDKVSEVENGHLRLKKGTNAREVYDLASDAIKNDFMTRHPNVTQYREYVATNELDSQEGQQYDLLQSIADTRDRMEEEILTNGNTDRAKELQGYLRKLINDYNEVIATNQKNQEQAKEDATKNPEPINDSNTEPVPPVKTDETKPAQVQDISTVLGGWLGEGVAERMQEGTQPQQPVQQPTEQPTQEPIVDTPLTYDTRIDPYSHEINYRLNENGQPIPFQGMEEYLNNEALAEVSTNPDFLSTVLPNAEVVVRPYTDKNSRTSSAIYVILPYKGKNYIASIQEVDSLQRYLYRRSKPLPYDQIQTILQNLQNLRNKVLELNKQVRANPNLKIVPTVIRSTNGEYVNEKNSDNSPKNRKLTESAHQVVKDPYEITPDNTHVGITTGPRGNSVVRYKGRTITAKGASLGQPMWIIETISKDGKTATKVVKLNYPNFKDDPQMVDFIIDLLINPSNRYVDVNGVDTGIDPRQLLGFLVNYGSYTAVNPNDPKLDPSQRERLLAKQFYINENNQLVLGRNVYNIGDIVSNPTVRQTVKDYLMQNFHPAIDEYGLSTTYIGGSTQSPVASKVFAPAAAMLRTSNVDKIVMIPGRLEFTLKDFGIVEDSSTSQTNQKVPTDDIKTLLGNSQFISYGKIYGIEKNTKVKATAQDDYDASVIIAKEPSGRIIYFPFTKERTIKNLSSYKNLFDNEGYQESSKRLLTVEPGVLTLDSDGKYSVQTKAKTIGIKTDSDIERRLNIGNKRNVRRVQDKKHPNGISILGWYIKQGILLTDISDKLKNANLYIDDVKLVNRDALPNMQEANQQLQETVQQTESNTLELPTMDGNTRVIDINAMLSLLDGKRKGPNMVAEERYQEGLLTNEDSKMNPKEATEWLQKTLGITPEITQSVIDITEAGQAVVGRVTEDSILLSELAPEGVEYHEAWHRVSQLLISPKKRQKLYDKYRKLHGNTQTDQQIDEILAEDFRRFQLEEAQNYNFETKNWFRRIWDFVRLWSRTGSYSLANIYSNINRAKYNGVQPNAENVARFRQIYSGEGPNLEIQGYRFQNIKTVKQLDDITKSLTYAFFNIAFTDGKSIDYSDLRNEKPRFDTLKLMLQAQAVHYPSPTINEIVDKFDNIFAPMVANNLKNLGIRAIDVNEDQTISDIEEGAEGVNIGQHTVEGMNISIKDNAPAEVKFFFQTIPAYEIGQDGTPRVKIDPITHWPQFVDTNKVWVNVLKDLHGCRTLSNLVSKVAQLAKQGDPFYQALLMKLDEQISVKSQSEDPRIAMASEALLTKIMTVITSDVNNFVTAKISRDRQTNQVSMSLVDNGVDVKALGYPRLWSSNFFRNSGLFQYNEGGKLKADPQVRQKLLDVINRFNQLKSALLNNNGLFNYRGQIYDLHQDANIERAKSYLIAILNNVGIGIDKPTLNKILASGDFGSATTSKYDIFKSFISDTNTYGGLTKLFNTLQSVFNAIDEKGNIGEIKVEEGSLNPASIYNNLGIVKYLANYYASTHATDRSLSSLGPDGNSYYMVSQNNFAKDRLHEIVNDPEVQAQLNSVVYNQGSIILDAIRNGNKDLAIETLINFKDTTSDDRGRDYFGITDREDYIAKMTAILNDRIIFPTVADKKTYHFIRGLKLYHEPITFSGTAEHLGVRYGDNALDVLLGYCYDELNQIELCLRQIDDDPSHVKEIDGKLVHINEDGSINNDWLEPSRRIKNFHTPNKVEWKDDKGIKHKRTLEGNGARFLFLTGIYTDKGFINFNDPMKSAKENLQTAKDYFFNQSTETQKVFLSGVLNNIVKKELQTAKDLGLITSNDSNSVWSMRNVLLDSKELNRRQARYTNFDAQNAQGYAIFDMIADYTINSIISINEVEKLFSGAPAYYKVKYDKDGVVDVSVDKIKRLGSLTSTGLNNRLDFMRDLLDSDEYTVAELKDHEIKDKQYATLEELFTRSYIKETIQQFNGQDTWNEVKDLSIKELEERFPEETKIARTAAKKDVAGYKEGVNVADAAVYISPKMTERLLRMRGVWSYDIQQAFKVLTDPETADRWESDPKLYVQANKVILNAMKYMAFGTRFNEIPGLGIPYFNKMALFPLFKSVATGDIKKLYDRMTEPGNEVDMVLFDSSVKAGSRSPQKMYRQAKDSEIELKDGQTVLSAQLTDNLENDQEFRPDDLHKLVTYKQKYKYLRQQLETNPHTHEEQMLGTQFMKVGVSNLIDEDMYGPEGDQQSGSSIKQTIMWCLNELSDRGKAKISAEVFDKDGNVNITKLAKMLQDDAKDSDANDNVLSGLQVENGDLILPLDALSDNNWLESRFVAMIAKQVIDVHLPGGAFIQRSAFAMEATAQDVITEDMINDGKPLLMINEKDNSMDSVVSINLFKHFIPNYKKMTFRQARQWLLDHNIIGQNAEAVAIGYRIPTQSIASISALRFVDVFPEIMGDTIMLPEGFTKLTGSDFDIDKLYVARYGFDENGKVITDDSDAGIKNQMLDQYLRVLRTLANTGQLKGSIDNATENVKAILKDIEGTNVTHPAPFEVYSPTYQEARKAEYTGGKAGIGPFALNNAHHILTQLTKLKMASNPFTEAMQITDLGRIFDVPTDTDPRGSRILDWLSAMINAFVDIAKDPYIVRLNVNGWTYNMVSFLLRAGKGKQTFYFMYQPILREMAQEVLKTKGKYGVDRTKTPSQLEQEAIQKVLNKYDKDGKFQRKYRQINQDDQLSATIYSKLFSTHLDENGNETSDLREIIKNPEYVGDTNETQVMIYYAWLKLKPYADSLANLVKYSKIDTKKIGKSFAEQQNYYDGMQRMLDDPNFAPGEIRKFYDETFVGHKTENAIPFGISIFKNLLLRNTQLFTDQKNVILSLLGRRGIADSGLINSVIKGMEAQSKAQFFNEYIKSNNIDLQGMFKGEQSIAKRLNNFKQLILRRDPRMSHLIDNTGHISNDFIEFLLPNIENTGDNPNGLDFVDTSELLNVDQAKANNLINYWRELIEDPNPQISKLFKDLVVYAFITTGDNPTMNSFFQYVPNSYRIQMGYRDYMRALLDKFSNSSTSSYPDKDDFFRNNWHNDKLVKPVELVNSRGNGLLSIYYNNQMPNIVMGARLGNRGLQQAIKPINWITNIADNKKYPVFAPYIKIADSRSNRPENWHLYTLIGYKYDGASKKYIPLYGLISKKGYKYRGHTITEYGVQTQFDFNREPEWNYVEAMNNPDTIANMADSSLAGMGEFWSDIKPISSLVTYQNSNYLYSSVDTVVEEDTQADNVPLQEVDEPTEASQPATQQTIDIWSNAGNYQDLSNFAIRPFTHLGIPFQSVEQAFQFYKTEFSPKDEYNHAVGQAIMTTTKGADLRRLGRQYRGLSTKEWDAMAPTIMKQLIKDSFEQNPDALQRLLSTGNSTLTHLREREGSRWRTEFPRILMEVRGELRQQNAVSLQNQDNNQDNQQNIQSQVIDNTDNTNNDPVNFSTTQESIQTIESDKTILSNEELRKIRPYTGTGMPRIAVASEHTDPVFFSQRIIDILDGKLSVEDKFRNVSYSGDDFAALYLITKHDGLPLKKLLEYKIPKIIHFSITGLGGTRYEPGVMKPDDLLDRIKDFLDQGLDPEMVTVRIDPIIPGVTPMSTVENIVKRASEMGIKNIRFSVMDQYSTTKQFMERLGYDYSKYYDGNSLHAKPEVQQRIANIMLGFKDKYGVNLSTCAEPMALPGISNEACLSVSAVNNILGTSIPDTATGKQRKLCSCYGGKTDLLRYDNKCASSCVYCYAHHNANANAIYYNQDGTLKDVPLTRTREVNTQQTMQSMDELVNDNQQSYSFTDELAELGKKRKEQCK